LTIGSVVTEFLKVERHQSKENPQNWWRGDAHQGEALLMKSEVNRPSRTNKKERDTNKEKQKG
jgi:hypothetical protein